MLQLLPLVFLAPPREGVLHAVGVVHVDLGGIFHTFTNYAHLHATFCPVARRMPTQLALVRTQLPPDQLIAPSTMPAKKTAGPSYLDLIKAAIVSLKERGGSSLQKIKKFVMAKRGSSYVNGTFLRILRDAVTAGKLVQTKGSYKLAKATAAPKKKKAAPKKKAPAKKKKAAPKKKKKTAAKKK